jgi:hypothetical protein
MHGSDDICGCSEMLGRLDLEVDTRVSEEHTVSIISPASAHKITNQKRRAWWIGFQTCFGSSPVKISANRPVILTELFCAFLQANSGTVAALN